MSTYGQDRTQELLKLDITNVDSRGIRGMKSFICHMFDHLLPYRAKNGIYFRNSGVSITTNKGIVFGENGCLGEDKYYLMLRHIERVGDGSTKYDYSVRIPSISHEALEILSKKIEENMRRNAEAVLREFT